jgi:TRAP-type C4-dicarboxylate transport system substrate-binding protein
MLARMEAVRIRFGGYQPPASVHSQGAAAFGRALAARLGDGVRFDLDGDVVAAGRPAAELLGLVERGELTMCYFATSYLAHRVPELAVLDLPFVLDRRERASALLDGALGTHLAERVEAATGYRVLGYWDNGFRHLTNRVRPLRTPADCRGLRIRTLASELHQAVFARLGFEPVALDVKDLLAAVRAGTIDAQDNSLTNVHMFEIHRQHRHLTLSGHFYGAAFLLCHAASYHGWPIEVRQAVEAAAREATAAQRALAAAEDGEALAKLERDGTAIVRLTEGDRAAFADAVAPVTAEWRDRLGVRLFDYLS